MTKKTVLQNSCPLSPTGQRKFYIQSCQNKTDLDTAAMTVWHDGAFVVCKMMEHIYWDSSLILLTYLKNRDFCHFNRQSNYTT